MNAEAGEEPRPATSEPVTPGALLRTERERRALTVQQAAEDLHLDTWIIEALESDRFLALGAPVYARGHLRKYAMLLGLSAQSIMERYEALGNTPAEPTPVPATVASAPLTERPSKKIPLWIGIAVLVGAVVWGVIEVWTSPSNDSPVSTPAKVESVPPAATEAPVEATAPASEPPAVQGPAPAAAPPAPSSSDTVAVAPTPAPAAQAASGAGVVRLRLEFSDASWTEIYDAQGNRLLFDMGAPGRVRSVSGVAPLRVTLGYAGGVTLQVNDRPMVIPRRPGKDAAKFTVNADGAVMP